MKKELNINKLKSMLKFTNPLNTLNETIKKQNKNKTLIHKKRRVAFFHIGDNFVAFKVLAKMMDFEVIELPKPNSESVSYGISVSPEFTCFPYKVFIGGYIQAIKMGADLIFAQTTGGIVACQYSDFAYSQKAILKKNGYVIDMIIFEKFHPNEILKKLKPYKPDLTLKKVTETMIILSQKIYIVDIINDYYRKVYLIRNKKEAERYKQKWLKILDDTDSIIELYKFGGKLKEDFKRYPKKDFNKMIKIAVIGDIYSINVEYINNNIFERLLDRGVFCEPGHEFGDIVNSAIKIPSIEKGYVNKAKKYLRHDIGGLATTTIAHAIKYAENDYDGLIQIYPFTCMPETVVRSLLPRIGKDYNIPILYLPIDEQTGDAGFATRIDAFIDLLEMRKNKKMVNKK